MHAISLSTALIVAASAASLAVVRPAESQAPPRGTVVTVHAHTLRPERRPFTNATLAQLRVPAGFRINVFASGLGVPRMMAVGPDGTVYVTRSDSGDVVALADRDGDGRAEERRVALANIRGAHGLAIRDGRLYVARVAEVRVAELANLGAGDSGRVFLDGLPNGGQHSRRTLAFGPDGMLYLSIGSTCNDCPEVNPENAAMLRVSADGRERSVLARGLRNTLGWGWHPGTGELWGWDHGSDYRGDNLPPEELNRIRQGADYGWPFCYGARVIDRYSHYDPQGSTVAEYCARSEPAVLTYLSHAAPIGMAFYSGTHFPADYRNDAFVAMHGSWNRQPARAPVVLRVRFRDGTPVGTEPFMTGFLRADGRAFIGRPAGVVVASDGSLLISDDGNGAIWRVSYVGR
jgi:glucose/arabinose dehydrogenase